MTSDRETPKYSNNVCPSTTLFTKDPTLTSMEAARPLSVTGGNVSQTAEKN